MFISDKIEVIINSSNYKKYRECGYEFGGVGDVIIIDISHLSNGSRAIIEVKCDECDKEKSIKYCDYIRNYNNGDYLCRSCKMKSNNLKKYGVENVFQLEGGIIEYTRQVKDEGIENKFIGKNFVFDHRRAEKITDDVVSNCHQCNKPCDTHTNCANEACHLLFIQCDECSEKMENTCSTDCQEIIQLSFEEQKELRKGKGNSNKIFKKGRSEVLAFKK